MFENIKKAEVIMTTMEGYIPKIIGFCINILIALLIFIVGRFIIKFILKIVKKAFSRTKMEISVQKFLDSLIKAVLYVVLVIIVCDKVGIATTSFIALLGTAGVAIGLALQGSLSNFAGGVLILLLKPFKVGDYIIDNGTGKEGTVERIDLFYTVLITVDNKRITVPNGNLSNSAITNVTAFDKRRVDIAMGISYSADINLAKATMENIANTDESVRKDMEIFTFIQSLDASQVTVGLRVWVDTADYWTTYFRLNEKIKKAFDDKGIEIPFNQLEVHINNK